MQGICVALRPAAARRTRALAVFPAALFISPTNAPSNEIILIFVCCFRPDAFESVIKAIIMAAAVPENAPTAQNLIPLPVRQLYENHPSALRGDNLVRAAEYYTIEELLLQANKKIPTEKNTLAKYLSKAIGDLAIRNGSEPDLYRDAFDSCRATNWIARLGNSGAATRLLNKSCIMPASVGRLLQRPWLVAPG